MKPNKVKSQFFSMLTTAGVDLQQPDLLQTWEAFKNFSALPIECTHEGFLFECGLSKYVTVPSFFVHFVRFYYLERKGTIWSEMVDCTFDFSLEEDLLHLEMRADMSPASRPELEEFFERIETRKDFWEAVARHKVTKATIYVGGQ